MSTDDKMTSACAALRRLESHRKMTGKRRRRASYWLRKINRLEWLQQAPFRAELWGSLFDALESGKIKSLSVIR